MPGAPTGPAFCSTSTSRLGDIQIRIIDAGGQVVDAREDHSTAAVAQQLRRSGALLEDGAIRGEVAAQDGSAAFRQQWLVERA